ncbi:effector-associated constant component EACC1 [Streptomyces sp. LaPpAH-108]|uniref:effector-associated constant component EACC1 n=1 Tax=Streptomyces sp. LaPpAH-108 TaxID=1155714 RepID=UPI0003783402|nr:hypothetical protein [Streptomyces sp. LaPpAH-108]
MTYRTEDAGATVVLTVDGEAGADELRSLHAWLADVDELRGRAGLAESPPVPGTLGPVVDGVLVLLGPGGAVTALATAVVAWIRHRHSDVIVKVTRRGGASVELTGKRVQSLSSAELREFVGLLSEQLDADRQAADGGRPHSDAPDADAS